MREVPVDAIPELSETQVIVRSTWNRSPDLVDSQITYPIVSALLGAPGVKAVRGQTDFGTSLVYVIFDDGIDLYWARSRTLEYLAALLPRLPSDARTELGSDATALGWVFQYILRDKPGTLSLADLRAYQDWYLDYYLTAIPGVAEVAPVGGFVKQYQVNVDPNRLRAFGLSIQRVVDAVHRGNNDGGGRIIESAGTEISVRGLGYAQSVADLGEILVAEAAQGTPIRIKDVANVTIGYELRRGIADFDGTGEVVSGVVIIRPGQNALDVIGRIQDQIRLIQPSLPAGVEIVPVYDRTQLIHRTIDTSTATIVEVMITVAFVILVFLWHLPSALVPILAIPLTALIVFVPFRWLGLSANVMTLGGLAIAIGAMVDAAIIVVEQAHRRLEEWNAAGRPGSCSTVILDAAQQVARPAFFALLVIAVSFLPVFGLEAEEGRLFEPLAASKTLAMVICAVLAVTIGPALLVLLIRVEDFRFKPEWLCRVVNTVGVGRIRAEHDHPLTRRLVPGYERLLAWAFDHKRLIAVAVIAAGLVTIPAWLRLGTEFMPPFDEGAVLFMPSTIPGITVGEAQKLLQRTDQVLKGFPEVEQVLGKAGRAETATDPAPLSMFETLVVLRPQNEWRTKSTWYSSWTPDWLLPVLRRITPDRISRAELVAQFDRALQIPGVSNAWTMPIRGRVDMLATGIRTPLGLKVFGADVQQSQRLAEQIAAVLANVPGTRRAFAERPGDGSVLDIQWNREALARRGLTIDDAQASVNYAIGGDQVTTLVKGRERYSVNVRYLQDFRADAHEIGRVLVSSEEGRQTTQLGEVADIRTNAAPLMLRSEGGLLVNYVYLDIADRDLGGYIEEANARLRREVSVPPGYSFAWSGQFEALARTREHVLEIVVLTLLSIFVLMYLGTRSFTKTGIVLLAVPFSLIGAVWFLFLNDYQVSVAVWIGLITLLGIDAETGVFMLLYLDQAYERAMREGRLRTDRDLRRAVLDGAARRLRPKLMTLAALLLGLFPVMWSSGTGSDVMKRIAAPVLGGIVTSVPLELLVYPLIFHAWKRKPEMAGDESVSVV